MEEINKSYNKYKKKYRWERTNFDSDDWHVKYDDKETVNGIAAHGFQTGNFKFRVKPYKFYFLWRLWWSFLRIKKCTTQKLIKKETIKYIILGVIIAVSGTVIGYWLLKFVFEWI